MKPVIPLAGCLFLASFGLVDVVEVISNSLSKKISPVGFWLTEDKDVIVEIQQCQEKDDAMCGFIRALPGIPNDPELKKHAHELCGLPLLSELRYNRTRNRWGGGQLFDPETEKTYDAFVQVERGYLQVRAYAGVEMLGETLQWSPATVSSAGCEPAQPTNMDVQITPLAAPDPGDPAN